MERTRLEQVRNALKAIFADASACIIEDDTMRGSAIQNIRSQSKLALSVLDTEPETMTAEIDLEAVARTWWENEGKIDAVTSEKDRIKALTSFAEFLCKLFPDMSHAISQQVTRTKGPCAIWPFTEMGPTRGARGAKKCSESLQILARLDEGLCAYI